MKAGQMATVLDTDNLPANLRRYAGKQGIIIEVVGMLREVVMTFDGDQDAAFGFDEIEVVMPVDQQLRAADAPELPGLET